LTKPRTKLLATALVLAAASLATGCGEKSEDVTPGNPQPFDVALDFYVNADHAGLYTAIERGYFRDAGLDVRPRVPSDPSAPIKEVAAGRVDLAISYEPEVLLARDQGLPVKAVAALVDTPLTSLIWLQGSGIDNVKGLRGKTIATAGIPYQEDYLRTILERSGLSPDDVEVVNVQQGLLPAILSGRADAMFGGFLNVEGVDLAERGLDPRVVPVDRLGVPTYDELVLVADRERLASDPEPIREFIAALERGTYAAARDPQAATDAIVAAGNGLDPDLTRAEVDKTLPRLLPPGDMPYGWMDRKRWQRFADYLYDAGQLDSRPDASELSTNDLLPKARGGGG
jgi:putative hydroxymethylpyrimidine transport system substrate-binding protein